MCGICGVIGMRDHESVSRMVAALHHRGPDGRGQFDAPRASIGMTRLAIQDPSPNGNQPMANDDQSIWIVYNGELYNAVSERIHLEAKGYSFRSTGDTEVVLKLYQEHGNACLTRLQGIFALAIVDLRGGPGREKYLLARDAMGVKPLLYAKTKGGIVFASEIKALLECGTVERRIEPRAVRSLLLRGSVYQPLSIIKGVQIIPPAHALVIERGQSRLEKFWSFEPQKYRELSNLDYAQQVRQMRTLLADTVKAQLVSDVPIGAFLSGGVDSASLVALMAAYAGERVKTFSVGFGEELAAIDESKDAHRIAAHLGTNHRRIVVDGTEVAKDFDHVVTALDQPSVDGLNSYLVSRVAREDVTVAISGTGGDDLFMGYPWHASMLADQPTSEVFLEAYAARAGEFHQTFTDAESGQILAPRLRAAITESPIAGLAITDELAGAKPIDRMTALTLRGYTANQLLRDIDAMSMANSLEVRVPFLDTNVINFALSLPASARIAKPVPDDPMHNSYRASGIKRILIDTARPMLPEGFDTVPKRGFGMPFARWVRGPLRDLATETFDERRVAKAGVIDRSVIPPLRKLHATGRLSGWRVWLLMVLQRWLELNKVTA
ncbi:MAG: asparagine synthase (glutamine-hydrolyzing) [Rhodospirillaceae bacterium]|nr:asparagine synthase (glutamine-hydrolyzing) [Rhodospirillaceae bacterium]